MMLGNKNVTNKEKNNQNNVQNTTHRKLNIEQHKHQGNISLSRNFVECDPSFNQCLNFLFINSLEHYRKIGLV